MLNTLQFQIIIGWLFVLVFVIVQFAASMNPQQEARCLNCIRNVSSMLGGDVNKRCEGYFCGPYQISYTYWAEAGKPGNNQGAKDYDKCVRDKNCAEQAVKAYFKKFKRDCNNDGQIDCADMAAMHKGGPASCSSDWFYKTRYWVAFNKTECVTNQDPSQDTSRSDSSDQVNRQPVRVLKNQTLTSECLDCICEAVSGCNTSVNNCGSGTVCGPFAISQAYWKDGRKPGASWTACARTKECSSVAMKNYMEKYKRDCNGDGYINCEDYAAIHKRGPRACADLKDLLRDRYWNKFLACRANQAPTKDVSLVVANYDDKDQNTFGSRAEQVSTSSTPPPETATSLVDGSRSSAQPVRASQLFPLVGAGGKFDLSQTPSYELSPIVLNKENTLPPRTLTKKPNVQNLDVLLQTVSQDTNKFNTDPTPRKGPDSTQGYQLPTSTTLRATTLQRKPDYEDEQSLIIVQSPTSSASGWSSNNMLTTPHYHLTSTSFTTPASASHQSIQSTPSSTPPSSFPSHSPPTNVPHLLPDFIKAQSPTDFVLTDHGDENQRVPSIHDLDQGSNNFPYPTLPTSHSLRDDIPDFPDLPHSSTPDRRNFDTIINSFVQDFNKSNPTIPAIIRNKLPRPDDFSKDPTDSLNQKSDTLPSRSSPSPNKPTRPQMADPRQRPNKNNQESTNSLSHNKPKPQITANNDQLPQHQQSAKPYSDKGTEDNSQSDLQPIFGPNSVNMSSLFEKGLNESSRIASECLYCICEASSNCDNTVQCISKQREKNRCGPYMISWNQYQESDISSTSMLAVPAGIAEEIADEKMYYACTTDRICAEKLIHLYIEKYQKDCNNDGKIDCFDIAAIHRVGPDNCNSGKFLTSNYWRDFSNCYTNDRLTTTVSPQLSVTVR